MKSLLEIKIMKRFLNAFWKEFTKYLNRKINDIEISNKDEFKTRQVLRPSK